MKVTKATLEETIKFLRGSADDLTCENILLTQQVKHLNEIIGLYSRMPSLLIAVERMSDALAQTVDRVFRQK